MITHQTITGILKKNGYKATKVEYIVGQGKINTAGYSVFKNTIKGKRVLGIECAMYGDACKEMTSAIINLLTDHGINAKETVEGSGMITIK